MPTDADHNRDALTEEIAGWLAKSGRWGTRTEAARRIRGVAESIKRGADCSFLLTEFDLDGSIFYVPRALEFARHLPFEELADEEYANDLWWTCGALLTFLNTWHAELDLAGLTEPIMTAVDAARVHWTETFPPPHSQLLSKGIAESCEWWPATILLNTPLEPASASVARTQFVDLLSRWTANLSSAAASANLLALFFAMRSVGGHMKLFKDSFMVGCASDKELCARHWQIAAPLLASACGTEYTELLKLELLKT